MKFTFSDILIYGVAIYFFIGLSVVTLQSLNGAKCGPIQLGGQYVYSVNQNASRFWLWRSLQWLPTAWENVVDGDVGFGDFISPKECIWVPDGKNPAETTRD